MTADDEEAKAFTEFDFGWPRTLVEPAEPDEYLPTTLGTSICAWDEIELDQALQRAGFWTKDRMRFLEECHPRDWSIAEAAGRWSSDLVPSVREYVPGDVCGLRASACHSSLQVCFQLIEHEGRERMTELDKYRAEREMVLAAWMYGAVPFFLPVSSAVGIAGSHPPDPELLDELHLPFPRVGVYFGADLALPDGVRGGDEQLLDVMRQAAMRDDRVTEVRADRFPPDTMTSAQIALAKGAEVRLAGVIFRSDDAGHLADDVLWLTVVPAATKAPRRLTVGRLSRARLRPLALNLAAATAWGDWHPPPAPLELPGDLTSAAFRKQLRRGVFRRREPSGAAVGVRVLDTQRMESRSTSVGTGTHASPVTHLRRGHWRRQRVGPREDWRHEQRFIPPVLVNPGHASDSITIYRLPEPPD